MNLILTCFQFNDLPVAPRKRVEMANVKTITSDQPPQQFNWHTIAYLTCVHFAAIAGVLYIPICKWQTLVWTLVLYFSSGIGGVTGGMHRLWAHHSYKAHWTLRIYLMLCASIANQGSIYHWVRNHRIHHKFSETDADPHNVRYSSNDINHNNHKIYIY